jgi:hypothetical protein
VFADQFPRNGMMLDQRFGVRNGDTSAVSRGGGGGFTGIFEIVAEDKAGVVVVEQETLLRAERRLLPLAAPCCPLLPLAAPCCPQGNRANKSTPKETCQVVVVPTGNLATDAQGIFLAGRF